MPRPQPTPKELQPLRPDQLVEVGFGVELKATLPSHEVVVHWRVNDLLRRFRGALSKRLNGLLKLIPDPDALLVGANWTLNDYGKMAFLLNFDGNVDDIFNLEQRHEFERQSKVLGLSVPGSLKVKPLFWKSSRSSKFLPHFPYPLEGSMEKELRNGRQEFQWIVQNLFDDPGNPANTTSTTAVRSSRAQRRQKNAEKQRLGDVLSRLRSLQVQQERELEVARGVWETHSAAGSALAKEITELDTELKRLYAQAVYMPDGHQKYLHQHKTELEQKRLEVLRETFQQEQKKGQPLSANFVRLEAQVEARAAEIDVADAHWGDLEEFVEVPPSTQSLSLPDSSPLLTSAVVDPRVSQAEARAAAILANARAEADRMIAETKAEIEKMLGDAQKELQRKKQELADIQQLLAASEKKLQALPPAPPSPLP